MAPVTDAPAINPRQLKHISIVIDDVEYAAQVKKCTWKPSGGAAQTWQGGTPDAQYTDKAPTEYELELVFIADWEQEDSLANVLYEFDGQKADISYMPHKNGLAFWTAEITIAAPTPPDEVGAWPETTISMPSSRPVRDFKPVTP